MIDLNKYASIHSTFKKSTFLKVEPNKKPNKKPNKMPNKRRFCSLFFTKSYEVVENGFSKRDFLKGIF
jgi:hypothetical protein